MTKLISAMISGFIFAFGLTSERRHRLHSTLQRLHVTNSPGYKITNPQNIAIWLSGYYNGKREQYGA